MVAVATTRLEARLRDEKDVVDSEHSDLLSKFLASAKDQPQTLTTAGITGLLMSITSGSVDTIATTVTAALYRLMKSPSSFDRLRKELVDLPEIPDFADDKKLSCLDAVIKETMRLDAVISWPMDRKVPAGGATIAGMFFPEGTGVGCMPSAVHRNTDVYGEDVEVFRPERWLTPDPERLQRMEAARMGFSRGRRSCLGQNIAVLQVKKVLPAIVMKF